MGKDKRQRQKFHKPAPKCTPNGVEVAAVQPAPADASAGTSLSAVPIRPDLFAGVNINMSRVRQTLDTVSLPGCRADTMSVASMRSTKSNFRDGNKQERRKQRRDHMLLCLNNDLANRTAEKERLKRKQTAVVGDMRPLCDALPTVEEILEQRKADGDAQQRKAKTNSKKQKYIQEKMNEDMATLLLIAGNRDYQKDMFSLVSQSVQERLRLSRLEVKEKK